MAATFSGQLRLSVRLLPSRSVGIHVPTLATRLTLLCRQRTFRTGLTSTRRFITTGATSPTPTPVQHSLLRRFITFCAIGVVFTSAGFIMAASPAISSVNRMLTPPTDEETLSLFTATDELTQKIENFLRNHPIAQELRNNPDYIESRPHLKIAPEMRSHNLTGGTMAGPGKLWVPPLVFSQKDGNDITVLAYLGNDLCGHPGVVHGGCMATLIDECFARCCFARLPNKIGMTANLNINYKVPLPADNYVALKAKTVKVEGRKAWVDGHLETLVDPGQTPTIHCDATALFIEPRQAASMARLYGAAAR